MEVSELTRAEYDQRLAQPLGFILSYIAGDPDSLLLEPYNPITATPLKLYSDLPHDLGNRLTHLINTRHVGSVLDVRTMILAAMDIDTVLYEIARNESAFRYISTLTMRREISPGGGVSYHKLY